MSQHHTRCNRAEQAGEPGRHQPALTAEGALARRSLAKVGDASVASFVYLVYREGPSARYRRIDSTDATDALGATTQWTQ